MYDGAAVRRYNNTKPVSTSSSLYYLDDSGISEHSYPEHHLYGQSDFSTKIPLTIFNGVFAKETPLFCLLFKLHPDWR
jgi:hypothetical protein